MSEERETVIVRTDVKAETLDKIEAKTPESRAQHKARLVQVLERGVVHDRLKVELPPSVYGEWVRRDPLEINRMRMLGFDVDTEYAPKRALHSDGTGAAGVADVIFMTTSRQNKDIIDEIRQDQINRLNSKPGDNIQNAKEEQEFAENVARATDGEIPVIIESKLREARKAEIEEAMSKINKQTIPAASS